LFKFLVTDLQPFHGGFAGTEKKGGSQGQGICTTTVSTLRGLRRFCGAGWQPAAEWYSASPSTDTAPLVGGGSPTIYADCAVAGKVMWH
jgi:hypothetical protein